MREYYPNYMLNKREEDNNMSGDGKAGGGEYDSIAAQVGSKNLLDLYQEFTPTTFVHSKDGLNVDLAHVQHGLFAEAGEIAAAYQKFYRGDYDEEELHDRLKGEMGGLLYYLAQLANLEGIKLSGVLLANRDALIDRQNRGVLQGDGDTR